MSHPLDRVIASPLSFDVLQRIRREAQLPSAQSDERNGLTVAPREVPSPFVSRSAALVEREQRELLAYTRTFGRG